MKRTKEGKVLEEASFAITFSSSEYNFHSNLDIGKVPARHLQTGLQNRLRDFGIWRDEIKIKGFNITPAPSVAPQILLVLSPVYIHLAGVLIKDGQNDSEMQSIDI